MNRKFLAKLTILVGAVMTALVLTVYRPTPSGVPEFALGEATARAAPGTTGVAAANATYKLTDLKVFNGALVKIRDNYVDPTRIDPKAMLYAALDSVQRNVAEVLVEPNELKHEVTVTVNDQSKTFSVKDVDSPWKLSSKLKEIFRFIQANMNPGADNQAVAEVEYAAVNGVLSTLDPHSNLMNPEDAKDMDIQTSGKFGGIGITIGLRKKQLTVLNLINNETPAAKAGLEANDHIVKINGQQTQDLSLNEAMSRLRGDPQTKVVVTIERADTKGQFDVSITRDFIHVSVVSSHLLKGNVGYLKIDQFSSEVYKDLKKQIADLKKQGAKAWVLDMRWNPGGLLDQAVKVVDLFVESGTIVTTVGYAGKQRDEKRAQVAGTESGPLAVIVNGGSASASEIVAGALKNLNRAIIVGETSFGKGSVQVMFDNDDGSKLKLTIAQYLTPGDVSIQSVGITPDIELVPVRVPEQVKSAKDLLRLLGHSLTKESDLDAHLTSKNARKGDKPSESMKYLYEAPKKDKADKPEDGTAPDGEDPGANENDTPEPDKFVEDWQIQFARDFVAQAASQKRQDMLSGAKKFVQARRADEEQKISAALGKLGIDWSTAPAKSAAVGTPKLVATFTTDKTDNKVMGGEEIALTGSVTNSGDGAAYQVHAHAVIDDWTFEDTELVFGKIGAGETRTFTAYLKVDKDAPSRVEAVTWAFTEANGVKVDATPLKVAVVGVIRPQFAYTYQLVEESGNGDGLLQTGEAFKLRVTVKNAGAGKSEAVTATFSTKVPMDGILVSKGRYEFETGLAPGEAKTMDFAFDVKKEFGQDQESNQPVLPMELTVYDATLREGINQKVSFVVHVPQAGPEAAAGKAKFTKAAEIREGAADDAPVIGTARKGSVFKVIGKLGTWTKIEVEAGRPGFVASAAVTSGGNAAVSANGFVPSWQVTPPTLALNTSSLETTTDKYKLTGTAQDDTHVEDVYVVVSNREAKIDGRKVFYKSNRSGKVATKLDFAAEVPVWPGNNILTVVARENGEVRTIQTVYVWRSDGQSHASAK